MIHQRLNRMAQWDGAWTDLFILGTTRNAGATDFSDADNDQTINLMTPAAGDVLRYPTAIALTKIAFAGDSASAIVLDVGLAGGVEYINAKDMFAANAVGEGHSVDSATSGAMLKKFDGATPITAQFVKTGGTQLALLTAGEVWIYLYLDRLADLLTNRYG